MDSVSVYDVSAVYDERASTGEGWYKQVVTGDIPEPRVDFCLILLTAADATSRNM